MSKTRTPEYRCWTSIKDRCYNPKMQNYKYYGGRGIVMCDRWKNSFENFLNDMGKKPSKEYSIERIDPNKNYEPGNCIWILMKLQQRNTRKTIKFGNELLVEIAEKTGVSVDNLYYRYKKGKSAYEPVKKLTNITYNGLKMSQASLLMSTDKSLVSRRIKSGWSVEKAFTTPPDKSKVPNKYKTGLEQLPKEEK